MKISNETIDNKMKRLNYGLNYGLKTMLIVTALCAISFAVLVQSENKYTALNWILPPLILLSHSHQKFGCAHLFVRFFLAVLVGSALYFPAVLQDTQLWEQSHQEWIAQHPSNFDATNENLRAFFGFIPASIYASSLLLLSAGFTCLLKMFTQRTGSQIAGQCDAAE